MQRIERARKKVLKEAEFARQAAELRETRTRRQTKRAQYVYNDAGSDVRLRRKTYDSQLRLDQQEHDDGGDDYRFQDQEEDDEDDFESNGSESAARPRRSTRKAVVNANGKRPAPIEDWQGGERRSTRQLAAVLAQQDKERETKRAKTKSESPPAIELAPVGGHFPVVQQKHKVVKDNELVVDAVAGKKKSKFWVRLRLVRFLSYR